MNYIGEQVSVVNSDGAHVFSGIIMKTGSCNAMVNDVETGDNHYIPYEFLKSGSVKKTAQTEVLKEQEKDGNVFVLEKIDDNIDGELSTQYKITVDDNLIWESENITTNVYDVEQGWSAPDDFDENKLELIEQSAESGFDLVVNSYTNIVQNITEEAEEAEEPTSEEGEDSEDDVPEGEPAFAPGEGPDEETGEVVVDESGEGVEEPEGPEELEEPESEEAPFAEEASLSRSILSSRLHRNPEHRLNPALREEMGRRGLDSSEMNDLELAEKLKDFDYSKISKRIQNKLNNLR
jgi:hypothetical protein